MITFVQVRSISMICMILWLTGCASQHNLHTEDGSDLASIVNSDAEHDIVPSGYGRYDIAALHAKNIKGKGVKVAVLDTGIDLTHPDLSAKLLKNFVNKVDTTAQDENGHGTKIAGIINAKENNYALLGVAPQATLFVGKVANDMGDVHVSNLAAGIKWATEQQVDIINISLEFDEDHAELHSVIKEAYEKGIIIVASSGNRKDESSGGVVAFPAAYSEVIAVGMLSTGMLNEAGKLSKSGFADPKIDVYAPSEDIVGTYLNNKLTIDTGASLATAYVSGYAALLVQDHRAKGTSYNKESITKEMQDVFHKYMSTTVTEIFFIAVLWAYGVIRGLLALLGVIVVIWFLVNRIRGPRK